MTYQSTKTYGHEIGLSVAFRQWRAKHSHCKFLHGYALGVRLVFEGKTLDERGWVVDFGALKQLKAQLVGSFDHKTVIAADDPEIDWFKEAYDRGVIDLVILPAVGCERFAEYVYGLATTWVRDQGLADRVCVASVEVMEHGANSAIFKGQQK